MNAAGFATEEIRPAESLRISLGDVTLHVDDWGGQGEPIVFAHPTGFLGRVWLPIIRRLRARGFTGRIYTYDQRGHGLSSKPDRGYEWKRFIEDTSALLETLDVRGAVGVGHSAGGTTLAGVAAEHPERFRRLVLVDPILFDPELAPHVAAEDNPMSARTRNRRLVWPSRDALFASYRAREPYDTWTDEALRAYIEHGTFERPDGEIELLCPGRIEAQVYRNATSIDGFSYLARVRAPVLFVRGSRSSSFPEDRAEHALAATPKARLVTLDATHFVPMELPDEVTDLILEEVRTGVGP